MFTFYRNALFFLFLLSTSALAADHMVTAGGSANVFNPRSLTINAGDTVTFVNGGGFHNLVADDNSFTSGPPSDSWSLTQAFPNAGTFPYHCQIHGGPGGVGMSGSIIVNAATTTTAPIPVRPPDPGRSGSIGTRFSHSSRAAECFHRVLVCLHARRNGASMDDGRRHLRHHEEHGHD